MKAKRAFLGGVLFSLTIGALLFAQQRFGISRIHAAGKTASRTAPSIVLNTNALPKDTRGITSFAPVVKRVAPSVVTIYSSKIVRRSPGGSPFDDPVFRRFFGGPEDDEEMPTPGPRGRGGRQLPQRERKEQSLGSGVIISADG